MQKLKDVATPVGLNTALGEQPRRHFSDRVIADSADEVSSLINLG